MSDMPMEMPPAEEHKLEAHELHQAMPTISEAEHEEAKEALREIQKEFFAIQDNLRAVAEDANMNVAELTDMLQSLASREPIPAGVLHNPHVPKGEHGLPQAIGEWGASDFVTEAKRSEEDFHIPAENLYHDRPYLIHGMAVARQQEAWIQDKIRFAYLKYKDVAEIGPITLSELQRDVAELAKSMSRKVEASDYEAASMPLLELVEQRRIPGGQESTARVTFPAFKTEGSIVYASSEYRGYVTKVSPTTYELFFTPPLADTEVAKFEEEHPGIYSKIRGFNSFNFNLATAEEEIDLPSHLAKLGFPDAIVTPLNYDFMSDASLLFVEKVHQRADKARQEEAKKLAGEPAE